ncbi:prepilin-type N-terminal cleavage/methylation domain-containing protein [uncultured Vibrio sp.]|uniref:PilW family protein n=1 Tax=uncultured Vibrio sp. TaxID=114054 RepID=UPI0026072B1B|nr:prepilin-type N-terminal cleavage/methylation domain-containing protein [uncultured Vibrio sp.]
MRDKGFTLIEMILAIVVSSIVLLGVANFTELGIRGYFGSVERFRLQTEARFVLEKLSREVRHAVPNIFPSAVSSGCVSFYPIVDSGFYSVSGSDINFLVSDTGATSASLQALSLVINPTQPQTPLRLDSETSGGVNNVFALTDVTSLSTQDFFTIPSGAVSLIGGSVSNRHYVFDKNNLVEYCLAANHFLTRNGMTISDRIVVENSDLSYQPATVQSNGLVEVVLEFAENNESTLFEQDIQVINVP